jgi:T-complex protein 1 subunit alpha
VVLTLADMEGNESFDASCLGEAEEAVEKRVADDAMVSTTLSEGCCCARISVRRYLWLGSVLV